MNQSRKIISMVIGTAAAAILLTGCGVPSVSTLQNTSTPPVSGTVSNGATSYNYNVTGGNISSSSSPEANFNSAVESPLLDDTLKPIDDDMRSLIVSIFGGAKLTAVMNDLANHVFNVREYTVPRFTTPQDAKSLMDALKAKGFAIDTASTEANNVFVSGSAGKYQVYFTFTTGNEQKVGLTISLLAPVAQ